MPEPTTPRDLLKALLRGEPLPRSLIAPIIFSLGSRLENLSLRDFLSNPTKITNALRQIRATLKVDGVTCYFDSFLEAEALGCRLDWQPDGSAQVSCPPFSSVAEVRRRLSPLDQILLKPRVRAASEVIRRLKIILKDEPVLMVGVSGPLTLAKHLLQRNVGPEESPSADLVEFAAEVTATLSKSFVEAGADLVCISETPCSHMSAEAIESWVSLLDPIINLLRFYEVLPLIRFSTASVPESLVAAIHGCGWKFVSNLPLDFADSPEPKVWPFALGGATGIPTPIFCEGGSSPLKTVQQALESAGPILLTSAEDLPLSSDLKQIAKAIDTIRTPLQPDS